MKIPIVVSLIVVAAISLFFGRQQIFGYDSYTECVHKESQKVDNPRMVQIYSYCGNLMKYEVTLGDSMEKSIETDWSSSRQNQNDYILTLKITYSSTRYHITEIKAEISELKCSEVEDGPFGYLPSKNVVFRFEETGGSLFSDSKPSLSSTANLKSTERPQCMRRLHHRGYHK